MKKVLLVLLTFVLLCSFPLNTVLADGSWYCETCGAYRDSEFCPVCGAQRPASEASAWICPKCGNEIPSDYQFCPDDGTKKVISHGSWPVIELNGTGTSLRSLSDSSKRHQAQFGPGSQYPDAGAYKPAKATSVIALFKEGNYVCVDMTYTTVGRRCVYFKASALSNASADELAMNSYSARTKAEVQPMFGPGQIYDPVVQKVAKGGKTLTYNVTLPARTSINVFFENNGWVFAEFGCALGTIRAWIPVNQVEAAR